jgi:hypothetical protein
VPFVQNVERHDIITIFLQVGRSLKSGLFHHTSVPDVSNRSMMEKPQSRTCRESLVHRAWHINLAVWLVPVFLSLVCTLTSFNSCNLINHKIQWTYETWTFNHICWMQILSVRNLFLMFMRVYSSARSLTCLCNILVWRPLLAVKEFWRTVLNWKHLLILIWK